MTLFNEIAQHYLEVICTSSKFNTSQPVNNLDLLFPYFRKKVIEGIEEYKAVDSKDSNPYIYETYRSHVLQTIYYNRGASKIRGGNILKAGMHHFGIAVDIVNVNWKDRVPIVDWKTIDYVLLKKVMNAKGLYSLSFEACHFQLIPTSDQGELRETVYKAVKTFQQEHGLVPDGIVGPKTLSKLKEVFL